MTGIAPSVPILPRPITLVPLHTIETLSILMYNHTPYLYFFYLSSNMCYVRSNQVFISLVQRRGPWELFLNFNFPFQHSMKSITSSFTVNYFHVPYNVCTLFSTAFYYGVVSYSHGQEVKYKENVKVKKL
jgi:hypothetical protein